MLGSDGIAWQTQVTLQADRLMVTRSTQESGRFVIPWEFLGERSVAVSTATLTASERPYHLPLELCRGTLARIQDQLATWESRGFTVPSEVQRMLTQARERFAVASLCQQDVERCGAEAGASLEIALRVLDQLGTQVTQFCATGWSVQASTGLWGLRLRDNAEMSSLDTVSGSPFNFLFLPCCWRDAEPNPSEWQWRSVEGVLRRCRRNRGRLACGPLLQFNRHDLPDWLYVWGDDFEAIQSYVVSYIRAAVRQFSGQVSLWHCTAATNVEDDLQLSEEQRLRLTVSALEALRQSDAKTPAIVSIKQPWGEYLGRTAMDLSPWQFTDILVRGELGLSGIGLEIQLACAPGRTLTRDLLEFNRLIDHWSVFGLPLVVFLSTPTPGANQAQQDPDMGWPYVKDLLSLLTSRSAVHGVVWDQIHDDADWVGGLLDREGNAKPILHALRTINTGPAQETAD
jgi:hypothetical protein